MKQGEEDMELLKDSGEKKENYIFQDNKKTIVGIAIIVAILALIILGISISGLIFGTPL
ncbi:MAG: hypothetical protein WBG90_12325 [Saonia sp.]